MGGREIVQRVGSGVLARLGLTRRRHVLRLSVRIAELEREVARLQAVARADDPAATLATRSAQLAAALRELEFRTARWRDCAEGRGPADGHDFGFAPLPPAALATAPGELHEKRAAGRPLISGLTTPQAFYVEAACLTRLHAHAGPGPRHFPAPVALDAGRHVITMTRQGTSLDQIPEAARAQHAALIRPGWGAQLRRIVAAMERARVVHLDMHPTGRNITVDAAGTISLIDFDLATVDDVAFSAEIARRHADWRHNGRYDRTFRQLEAIVGRFLASAG